MKRLIPFLVVALLALLPAGVSHTAPDRLPSIGGGGGGLVSGQQEKAIGQQVMTALRRSAPLMNDPLLSEYLEDTVYRMVPNVDIEDRELTTVVIDSPELNAFAVPGGVIGINAGLLLHAETEHQFASVIAHEIAHISQRHFSRRLEQQQRSTPMTVAGLVAGILLTAATGSEAGIAAIAGTQAMAIDNMLRYSRAHEQEADRVGLEIMARSDYDPRGMPEMFEQMLRQTRLQGNRPPEYLSTHPVTESRVADTRSRADRLANGDYRETVEYRLMRYRVMVHYSSSGEAAVDRFRDRVRKDPDSRAARYGLANALIRHGQAEEAKEKLRELLDDDPGRIPYVVALGEALRELEQMDEAVELLEKHVSRNPGNLPLTRTLAETRIETSDYERAARLYERLTRDYKSDHTLWEDLAEAHGRTGNVVEVHRARGERDLLMGDPEAALRQFRQGLDRAGRNHTRVELLRERMAEANDRIENAPRRVVR